MGKGCVSVWRVEREGEKKWCYRCSRGVGSLRPKTHCSLIHGAFLCASQWKDGRSSAFAGSTQ